MPMDNVTLENTQQSISSRDAKSVASVMVNGKWVNLSDTLEQANVKSDVGTVAKQVAAQQEVVSNAASTADSAVAYANDAIKKSRVNSQAIDDINSAVSDAKQGANDALSRAMSAWDVAIGAKSAVTDFDPLLKSAQSDAGKALTQIADTANALSDAKTQFGSDVAAAKELANTAQTTADSAVAVASDASSNATVAIQTASQASITASSASGQAASAVLTANGAMTTASNAKSDATVAIQTASGARLTVTNAQSDATVAKQTASEAKIQASNAESDFAQLSIRANKIEANVANNSGAIASVQQTANGLTTTVGKVDDRVKKIEDNTNWTTKTGPLDMDTLTTTQNIYYRDTNLKNADGETGWAYIQVVSIGERVTQTVWHDRSSIQHTRTGALNSPNSNYNWDAWNKVATNAQVVQVKQTVDGIATTINDPKTGLNATYQTAAGNATTISSVKGDVTQLQTTANGLTSRVGSLESKTDTQQTAIEQNKNAIALKAAQTDVDTLKGNVTDLQAEITTQANEIKSKVTQSDVTGMLTNYATQEYTQSLVTQKADDWNLNLTKLKTDVNARDGINLLQGTSATENEGPSDFSGIPVTAGDSYTFSGFMSSASTSGVIAPYIQFYDGSGTKLKEFAKNSNVPVASGTSFVVTGVAPTNSVTARVLLARSTGSIIINHRKLKFEHGSQATPWTLAPSDMATVTSVTNLSATVDGIQSQVYNSDGSSKITQLSNLIATKVSQGDYNSQITQLQNDINQRVQVGNVISQINQEAGGDTLIQVSNGKKSLILDAANTIITGEAWIPGAAIANLTADQIQAGTLSGSKVHAGDNSGNGIDMGVLSDNYVGFHAYANNGDNTFIDYNGIHNYGANYDTRIQQGKITTDYLAVKGGGMIDFQSGGAGITMDNQEIKFYNSGDVNGGISFAGSNPIADRNSGGGNELRLRYDGSFALTPISDESTRLVASTKSMGLGYNQAGSTTPDKNLTGLWVNNSDRYVRLGVWNSNSAWSRAEFNSDGVNINYSGLSIGLNNNLIHMYMNGNYSATAIQLKVDGWAWINGYCEAMGHTQHSTLSTKTRIEEADPDHMLDLVNNTELTTFAFKSEVAEGTEARHIGPIIDDVNDVAQYRMPAEFIAPTKTARDDDNMIGALFGAVQALTKRINALESKVG